MDGKWILCHEMFEHRHEVMFTDLLYTTDHLPLCHLINGIDEVHPFLPVEIPLMNRIYPYVSRLSLRIRTASFS